MASLGGGVGGKALCTCLGESSSFPACFALTGALPTGGSSFPGQCDEEALAALFGCAGEEEEEKEEGSPSRSLLSVQELALFDPFSKEGRRWGKATGPCVV